MNIERVGIMGGTFDPIHNGHLILSEYAREELKLNEILFIPTGDPPHKESKYISSCKDRYNMILLAISSNNDFKVSSLEMDRDGINYTIDTIRYLKSRYQNKEFYFILGEDSLLQIQEWKDYESLLKICKFIVAKRPDYDNKKLEEMIAKITNDYDSYIYTLNTPLIDISSTDIRNRVKNNLTIKYLLPNSVERYILKNSLYKD